MSIVAIQYRPDIGPSIIYKSHPEGFTFGVNNELRIDWTWDRLIRYFKGNCADRCQFITDKPFNKEDWL